MRSIKAVRQVSEQAFPGTLPIEEQLRFLLRYAVLAPSARNAQPWRFAVESDSVLLRADATRWQPVADPDQRELHLGLGCALENLLVAAEHFGFRHRTEYFPRASDPALVAVVTLSPGGAPAPERADITLDTLLTRRTAHGPFAPRSLTVSELRALEQSVRDPEIVVTFAEGPHRRLAAGALNGRASERLMASPAYRRELRELIGRGNFGLPWPLARMGRLAMASETVARWVERSEAAAFRSAPLLALVSAPADDRRAQVRSGQLLERLWLAATARGLALQPASAALELPDTRAELGAAFGLRDGLHPQELVRIGARGRHAGFLTPRRAVEETVGR